MLSRLEERVMNIWRREEATTPFMSTTIRWARLAFRPLLPTGLDWTAATSSQADVADSRPVAPPLAAEQIAPSRCT